LPILLMGIFSVRYFENKHLETVSELLNVHAVNVSNEASEFLRDTQTGIYKSLLMNRAALNRFTCSTRTTG
jgi:hypothetical protein